MTEKFTCSNSPSMSGIKCSRTPLIRTLVMRIAYHPDRLCPSGKFVENYTKLTCLEVTGYQIKNSVVLWLAELQMAWSKGLDAGTCCKQ
jgi:hypothetical protein